MILPGATYTEKTGLYVNTEGRVQRAERANFPPGEAREDWAILRALSDVLGAKLPFDSHAALMGALRTDYPVFTGLETVSLADATGLQGLADAGGTTDRAPFRAAVEDFYLTNPICRASAVMAECSALAQGRLQQAAE